jgi:hypothetical protein
VAAPQTPGPAVTFTACDTVTVQHRGDRVAGTVWSEGPDPETYWVVPDRPVPDMIQGCIRAPASQMERPQDDALF